jgi:type 2 lantibiotic biosynthesis protein LanM
MINKNRIYHIEFCNSLVDCNGFQLKSDGSFELIDLIPGTVDFIENLIDEIFEIDQISKRELSIIISKNLLELLRDPMLYIFNFHSEYKFNSFFENLHNQGIKNIVKTIFYEYPKLSHYFNKSLVYILNYFETLFNNFKNNLVELSSYYGQIENITKISWPIGDFHNRNTSNTLLTFSNGKEIYYKKRNPENNYFFSEFVSYLKILGLQIDFKEPYRHSYTNYYWEEKINVLESLNPEMINDYYFNLGNYLAIFYFVGIYDITLDNLLANLNCPIFIDLECIFRPNLNYSDKNPFPEFYSYFNESCVSSGLLPFWTPLGADKVSNIGGINKELNFTDELPELVIRNDGKLGRDTKKIKREINHIPKLTNNKYCFIEDYIEQFLSGFGTCMKFFLTNKNRIHDFINNNKNINKIKSRVLLRHTFVYNSIIKEIKHPVKLKDLKKTNLLLNFLYNAQDNVMTKEIIKSEINQIKNLDIPYFYTYPNSLTIYAFNNKINFPIIKETGLNATFRRILNLNDKEIENQTTLVKKSLICFKEIETEILGEKTISKKINANNQLENTFSKEDLKKYLSSLGEYILSRGISTDNSYNWFEISVGRSGNWEFLPKTPGIYDGLDGLGIFYLYLYKITNVIEFKNISKNILEKSIFLLEKIDLKAKYHLLSPLNFPLSTIFFLWHYSRLTGEMENILKHLIKNFLVPLVNKNINCDEYLDFVNGSAGLLTLVCNLYKMYPSNDLKNIIVKTKNHIINKSINNNNCLTWNSLNFNNLVGFAHGNSGFIFALTNYYEISQDKSILDYIVGSFNYIQSQYNSKSSSWYDLRYPQKQDSLASWCHGSSGIIISYAKAKKYLKNNYFEFENDLQKIIHKIFDDEIYNDDCICHGFWGNIEAISILNNQLNNQLNNPSLNNIILEKGIIKLQNIAKNHENWKTGFKSNKYNIVGLFLGLTGIGYNIMKMFWPDEIPSILSLDGPIIE